MEASTTQPTCAQRVHAAWQSRREDLKAMLDPSAEDIGIESTPHYDPDAEVPIPASATEWNITVAERTVTNDNGADLPIDIDDFLDCLDEDAAWTDGGERLDPFKFADWHENDRIALAQLIFDEHEDEIRRTAAESFNEYGLCFDYVAPGTFGDQRTGYWRYQISWGGPSEEIRFYGSPSDNAPALIEFWFLDWFDGAPEDVTSDEIARLIWDEFSDMDMLRSTYEEAME